MHALIVGCGFLGRRVARDWLAAGERVTALTRSAATAAQLRGLGIEPIVGDLLDPATSAALPAADVLLIAVAHDPASPVPKRALVVDGVAHLAREMCRRIGHVIHISSTSVYGQSDGSWVDETSPTEPATEPGRIAQEAERALTDACAGHCRLAILRLAGIYGPGRLIARIDQLRSRTPVAGEADAWLNLIHVDDAARCVTATASRRATSPVLLISDDRPLTRREFYTAVAREVGAPAPTFAPDAVTRTRTTGLNKRCRNARMHAELAVVLQHPDALAALPGVVAASAAPDASAMRR